MNTTDSGALQAKGTGENASIEIHELEDATWKLDQARNLFHALFHANPIPTSLTRLQNGLFIDANDAYLEYYGFERKALVGHTSDELHLPLDPDIRTRLIEQIQKTGTLRNVEIEITHPSGEKRTILASLQITSVENTEALITAFIDITERVQAEQQIRFLASELTVAEQAERQRVAQILHDDLQQRIFAIQMQLSFLKDAYEKNDLQAFAVDFPQLETWLAEAIHVTRQLSVDLNPPILHGASLTDAILWLISQMQGQYGLEVNVRSNGKQAQLDEKIRRLIFYAVRELLFNTVKHSGTLKASIAFEYQASYLRLTVSDQGKGFDQETINDPKVAHGLLILRHRLNLLGCNMQVESRLGEGTTITIKAPYEKADF